MRRRAITWLAVLALSLSLNAPAPAQESAAEPLDVVTTFSILDDLVKNVGGEAIVTHALAGAGGDSHTYEPAPNDVATLAEADLVFAIGLDFEPWLDGIYESSGSGAPRIDVSEDVSLLSFDEGHADHGDDDHAHEDEAGHGEVEAGHDEDEDHSHEEDQDHAEDSHGEFDPHIWHDVTNAVIVVETVRDALVTADPANAALYEANAGAYIAELEALDAWVVEQVATLPEDQRKLVTSHEALAYYANRYGFELVGTVFGTLSTEAGDPSAADIARLVAEIQAQNVNAIFAENTSNPAVMEAVAAEAGVTLAPTLYTDALGDPGSGAETYIDLIRTNTEEIVTALSGS